MTAALLNPAAAPLTMSSREIAELTGSTHDNVLKTIRRLAQEGVVSANETPYRHPQNGQTYTEFLLSFRDSMVVVSGYSSELRARIIDRWQELERSAAPAALDLRDPRQLAPITLQLAHLVQEQQTQLAAAAPKIAFAEAVGAAEDLQKLAAVAKVLGQGPRKFRQWLIDTGVLMVNGLPFQAHLDANRFRVIEVPFKDADGRDRIRLETRVTGRGVTFLQQRLARASVTEGA